MKPSVRFGLIVGVIGLALNVCVAAAVGICGPATALVAGIAAGFLTARSEMALTKGAGAREGAISGGIAGGLVLVGQVIGGIGALFLIQSGGAQLPLGQAPSTSADPSTQLIYYATGIGTGLCFGLVDVVVSALVGAGAGYLGTPERTETFPANLP
jgi:hypothetical protein